MIENTKFFVVVGCVCVYIYIYIYIDITYEIKNVYIYMCVCIYIIEKHLCIYMCVRSYLDKYISVATWPSQTKISGSAPAQPNGRSS